MRAKIFATLREWNILIGFCFVLGGVIFIAWISSMPPESATVAPTSASSQPPASQVASKDAAPAAPQSSPAARAPVDPARPSQPPAASEPAAHQMPGQRLSSTIERPGHLRQSDERSPRRRSRRSGKTSTPAPSRRSRNPLLQHPQHRPARRLSTAMRRQAAKSTENAKPATRWRPARTRLARALPASSARNRVRHPTTIIRLR